MDEILKRIHRDEFHNSKEPTVIYRLGEIDGATHDLVKLFAGVEYPKHLHIRAEGPVLFVVGRGVALVGDEEIEYKPGTTFFIPKEVPHGFKPTEDSLFLSIQKPPVKKMDGEEDLYFV